LTLPVVPACLPPQYYDPRISSSVLFLTLRPPPRSILFPYTTLFRSGFELRAEERVQFVAPLPKGTLGRSGGRVVGGVRSAIGLLDRKSTRLNSSHGSISYAVFCLKKKIQHRGERPGSRQLRQLCRPSGRVRLDPRAKRVRQDHLAHDGERPHTAHTKANSRRRQAA